MTPSRCGLRPAGARQLLLSAVPRLPALMRYARCSVRRARERASQPPRHHSPFGAPRSAEARRTRARTVLKGAVSGLPAFAAGGCTSLRFVRGRRRRARAPAPALRAVPLRSTLARPQVAPRLRGRALPTPPHPATPPNHQKPNHRNPTTQPHTGTALHATHACPPPPRRSTSALRSAGKPSLRGRLAAPARACKALRANSETTTASQIKARRPSE